MISTSPARRDFLQRWLPIGATNVDQTSAAAAVWWRSNVQPYLSSVRLEVVAGGVAHHFDTAALRRFAVETSQRTAVLVGNPPDGRYLYTCAWQGVAVLELLAGRVLGQAQAVRITSAYGEQVVLQASRLFEQPAFIAWGVAERALTPQEGGPLRLLVPNVYHVPAFDAIRRIEFLEAAVPTTENIQIQPHICMVQPPIRAVARRTTRLGGVAFAGNAAVQTVQVAMDGGPWSLATIEPPQTPLSWTRWQFHYTFATVGLFRVTVRLLSSRATALPAQCHHVIHVIETAAA